MARNLSRKGFTIVELLVVVTIIVVLLALLSPALSKAIYQAQLATCAAGLKATGGGILQYAMANKRYYPDRGLARLQNESSGQYQYSYLAPTALTEKIFLFWDMRPSIRDYVQINKQLVDPLCMPVDLENDVADDENVGASYTMWWGWRYDLTNSQGNPGARGATYPGMYKLGDRWHWGDESFRLLAGDYDLYLGNDANPVQGSHPDHEKLMAPFVFKYQPLFGTGAGIPITLSLWMRPGASHRGPIDTNHLYDDGSVARFDGVKKFWSIPQDQRDKRMTLVPNMANQQQNWKYYQVPRN